MEYDILAQIQFSWQQLKQCTRKDKSKFNYTPIKDIKDNFTIILVELIKYMSIHSSNWFIFFIFECYKIEVNYPNNIITHNKN